MLLQVRRAKSLRTDPTYVESVHNEFVQRINTSVTWTDPRMPSDMNSTRQARLTSRSVEPLQVFGRPAARFSMALLLSEPLGEAIFV